MNAATVMDRIGRPVRELVAVRVWVTGLLGYWVTGLLGYWVTGLLGYWVTGCGLVVVG